MKKIILTTAVFIFCSSCSSQDMNNKEKTLKIKKKDNKISTKTYTYDRKLTLKKYVNDAETFIGNGEIPLFIYNECLDVDEIGYCYETSNFNLSLRNDILNNLSAESLKYLYDNVDKSKIDSICKDNMSKEIYLHNKSWLFLIEDIGNFGSR